MLIYQLKQKEEEFNSVIVNKIILLFKIIDTLRT